MINMFFRKKVNENKEIDKLYRNYQSYVEPGDTSDVISDRIKALFQAVQPALDRACDFFFGTVCAGRALGGFRDAVRESPYGFFQEFERGLSGFDSP